MNLTLTITNVEQARQAMLILTTYIHGHGDEPAAAPAAVPADPHTPLAVLELGVRASNAVRSAGIETIEELVSWSYRELAYAPNVGRHTLDEVVAALAKRGLTLGMKPRITQVTPHP